jgi:hypothetical protein
MRIVEIPDALSFVGIEVSRNAQVSQYDQSPIPIDAPASDCHDTALACLSRIFRCRGVQREEERTVSRSSGKCSGGILMGVGSIRVSLLVALLCGSSIAPAQTPQPSLQERVAALKSTFATSQANLRSYEWIETTVVTIKGEEKSRKQQRCYYGADGALQKIVIDASPTAAPKRGLRGAIIANKKAELGDYMQSAVALVKSYLPPDPGRIQGATSAGNTSIQVLEPGKRVQVNFRDYQKAGDNLAIRINVANNVIAGVGVSSYLDSPADAVTLDASMGQLADGTIYTSNIVLNAPAKNITVNVQNTGYRKTS